MGKTAGIQNEAYYNLASLMNSFANLGITDPNSPEGRFNSALDDAAKGSIAANAAKRAQRKAKNAAQNNAIIGAIGQVAGDAVTGGMTAAFGGGSTVGDTAALGAATKQFAPDPPATVAATDLPPVQMGSGSAVAAPLGPTPAASPVAAAPAAAVAAPGPTPAAAAPPASVTGGSAASNLSSLVVPTLIGGTAAAALGGGGNQQPKQHLGPSGLPVPAGNAGRYPGDLSKTFKNVPAEQLSTMDGNELESILKASQVAGVQPSRKQAMAIPQDLRESYGIQVPANTFGNFALGALAGAVGGRLIVDQNGQRHYYSEGAW